MIHMKLLLTFFLFIQFLYLISISKIHWNFYLVLILILAAFLITSQINKFKEYFYHFWTSFIFGGLGMKIGCQIDMHYSMNAMKNMMSYSIYLSFFNFMTLLMVVACVGSCMLIPQCNLKRTSIKYSVIGYVFITVSMLIGMYIGRVMSIFFGFEMFYRYFFVVSLMGIFTILGYFIISNIYKLNLELNQWRN